MTMMNKKEDMNYIQAHSITTTTPLRKIPCHHAPARHPISSPVTSRTLRLKRRAKGYMGGDGKRSLCFCLPFNSGTSVSHKAIVAFHPILIKESTPNLSMENFLFQNSVTQFATTATGETVPDVKTVGADWSCYWRVVFDWPLSRTSCLSIYTRTGRRSLFLVFLDSFATRAPLPFDYFMIRPELGRGPSVCYDAHH
ncbi:hypothetical protein OUZ56_019715 [Daphnia magna]|uniref:Uncharacterized protein n=1 Tax=Daphnia magna TaxID=35525 RepID=A0ABQ9ZCE0_9CRUS|nr:hypothetical protein OUZ56_019715 [Daphnia magna]